MSDEYTRELEYTDFFKPRIPDREEVMKEKIEDIKQLIMYIFKDDPDRGEDLIDNVSVISRGNTENQLKLFNSFLVISHPIVFEEEQERVMSHDELEASFYLRNMAMNIIDMVLDMSAKRILQMQDSIHNLTEAIAISTRLLQSRREGDVDEQSNP